jgi:hypothetical protein
MTFKPQALQKNDSNEDILQKDVNSKQGALRKVNPHRKLWELTLMPMRGNTVWMNWRVRR